MQNHANPHRLHNDVILLKITHRAAWPCHTGRRSRFFSKLADGRWVAVDPVSEGYPGETVQMIVSKYCTASETLASRPGRKSGSSFPACSIKGTDAIRKKVAEEAAETIMAAKDKDLHVVWEVTDVGSTP